MFPQTYIHTYHFPGMYVSPDIHTLDIHTYLEFLGMYVSPDIHTYL